MSPETAPYGRRESRGQQLWADGDGQRPGVAAYDGQTYYQQPAIKKPHYRWLISGYLFAGGIAGFTQVLAALADLVHRDENRGIVRASRYLSFAAVLVSPVLLILDLHTPRRWFNMLRIFRWTSPMNLGSWGLTMLGGFAGLAALGQLLEDLRVLAAPGRVIGRLAGLPGALFGGFVSIYTGSLLAATSVPFWAAPWRLLPPLFGSSAASTGTAAASLAMEVLGPSNETAHQRLEEVAFIASATELALSLAVEQKWRRQHVETPMKTPYIGLPYRILTLGAGVALPLGIHAYHAITGRRSKVLSMVADAGTLLGGFTQRAAMTFGGAVSAEEPSDYFKFTQPSVTMGQNGHSEAALFARAGGR